jgi:hypothetical protein
MIVELDVFSGRPNPRWQLDEARARQLEALHHQLPAATEVAAEPPGLGYRGFLYALDAARWRAWKGFVTADDQTLVDRPRAVVRLLLGALPGEHAELREHLAHEIESVG